MAEIEKSLTGVVKHLLDQGWSYEDIEEVLGKRQTVIERHIPVPQPSPYPPYSPYRQWPYRPAPYEVWPPVRPLFWMNSANSSQMRRYDDDE